MQSNGFICRSCLSQLKSLARRQLGLSNATTNPPPQQAAVLRQYSSIPTDQVQHKYRLEYEIRKARRKIERTLYPLIPSATKGKRHASPTTSATALKDADPELATLLREARDAEYVKYKTWRRNFTAMTETRGRQSGAAQEEDNQQEPVLTNPDMARTEFPELLALDNSLESDEDAFRTMWRRRSIEDRRAAWPRLILAVLALFPRYACLVLRATWEEGVCPSYALIDAVLFLVGRPSVKHSKDAAEDLCDLLIFLLQHGRRQGWNGRWEGFQLRQWDLYKIEKNIVFDQAIRRFWQQLVSSEHPVHRNTALHFANRFAGNVEFKSLAMEMLENMVRNGDLDVNSPHAGALCTRILTPPETLAQGTKMTDSAAEYSERLLKFGFSPNLITYSVLIRDLVQKKQVPTAFDVLSIMNSQGLKPDAVLYSFLLHGAKLSESWLPMHMLVQQAFLDEIRDPVVWNELIHAIFMAYQRQARRRKHKGQIGMPAFHPMVKLYGSIFKPHLLRKLIPADVDHLMRSDLHVSNAWDCEQQAFLLVYRTPSWSTRGLLDPGYDTLTIMILGYINSLSSTQSILSFYSHFKELLGRGDTDAMEIVNKAGTRIHDYVLKALLQWEGNVDTCVDLVSEMAKRSMCSDISPSAPTPEASVRHPAPSIFTWSILVNALMFRREHIKAEQVMEIMREHGVEPSLATWNALVAGYANAQNVRKTVKSLERLEAAGLEGDEWTYKAWRYLSDKQAGLELLEAGSAERTQKLLVLQREADEDNKASTARDKTLARDDEQSELEAWDDADTGHEPEGQDPADEQRAWQDVQRQIETGLRGKPSALEDKTPGSKDD